MLEPIETLRSSDLFEVIELATACAGVSGARWRSQSLQKKMFEASCPSRRLSRREGGGIRRHGVWHDGLHGGCERLHGGGERRARLPGE